MYAYSRPWFIPPTFKTPQMLLQLLLILFCIMLRFNVIFTVQEVNLHSSSQSKETLHTYFCVDGYDYSRNTLAPGDTLHYRMSGDIKEDYKKGITFDIVSDDDHSASFTIQGDFTRIDLYLDSDGNLEQDKTRIVR